MDEAQFPEFVHEKFTRDLVVRSFPLTSPGKLRGAPFEVQILGIARQQQKGPRQPFFAGVKKLIDQILLDSDVSRKNVGHETVGERMFGMQHAHHLFFFYDQDSCGNNRCGHPHADFLTCQAPFPIKSAGPSIATTASLPTSLTTDSFYSAFLNVHHTLGGIALRVDFCDFLYWTTFLDTPAESRKAWASKAGSSLSFLLDFLLCELAIPCTRSPLDNKPIIAMIIGKL